jgi:16S rRNA A1518/A1519 N6-dimethyltransferase RsmA/KsgA/DIM1 with predicted DNA glycosylase/AP lyase activity
VATALQDELDKPEVDAVLESLQLSPSLRAEQLSVEEIIRMLEACRLAVAAKGKASGA